MTRALAVTLLVTAMLSLGPDLHLAGRPLIASPVGGWSELPILQDALPDRLALYTSLLTAILAALALDDRRPGRLMRWGLAAIAIGVLVPHIDPWRPAPNPRLESRIAPGSAVVSLPLWDVKDRGLELQAETGFRFSLLDKWMQDTPRTSRTFLRTPGLYGRGLSQPAAQRAFVRTLCADDITTAVIWSGGGSAMIAHALKAATPSGSQPSVAHLRCPQRRGS